MEGGKCKCCAEKIEKPAESNDSQDKALVTDVLVEKNVSSESVVLLDNEDKESENKENPTENNNPEDKVLETDVPVEKNSSSESVVLLDNEEKESEKFKPEGGKGDKDSGDENKGDHEPKPASDTPDKPAAQNEDKKVEESSKTKAAAVKDPSPLATFFKDWDKFTAGQKREIERFIRKKADEVRAAGGKVRPAGWRGQRPYRSRYRRDNYARSSDSTRRITRPVSSWPNRRERGGSRRRPEPWAVKSQGQGSRTVDHLLMKRVQDFIRLVSAIPVVNYKAFTTPREPLLPTPPVGYQTATRITGHMKNEDNLQRYADKSFIFPSRRPLLNSQQYTVKAEDVSRRPAFQFFPPSPSQRASGVRMAPYRPPGTRTVLSWSDRRRAYPVSTKITAHFDDSFKDKRFTSSSNNSTYKR